MTTIAFKELTAKELKELTLNMEDITPLGLTILEGADTCVFNGQFIDMYKGRTRVYQFGFTFYDKDDWYGKEGYQLIG